MRLSSSSEGMDVSSIDKCRHWNTSALPCAIFCGSAIGVAVLPYRLARETRHNPGSLALRFDGVAFFSS